MSERYTRLSFLPNNLYMDGSPLLIVAGALLKDNQSGKVLVQLKLKNLYHASLTACKVHVRAFDPSGAELEGVDSFSYFDLKVSQGEDFGAKRPINLPNDTTRSVSVCVIQAVFEDGNVWQKPISEWPQLELHPRLLSDRFKDDELVKQYEIEVGGNCKYVPKTVAGLRLCTCGAINLSSEKLCSQCHREIETLTASLDVPMLTEKMRERLAKEKEEEMKRIEQERQETETVRRKRIKILAAIGCAVVAAVIVLFVTQVILLGNRYKAAEELLAAGDYDGAIAAFAELGNYRDSLEKVDECSYQKAKQFIRKNTLDSGMWYTVGLRSDGTVVAVALNSLRQRQCDVSGWSDIVAVAAGDCHIVGLKSDGTVVVAGDNSVGQCDVSGWSDIVTVAAGPFDTFGLKSDGTVVAAGDNFVGRCRVSDWSDIVAVAAGENHTVGLKSDGTVVAIGENAYGQCKVSEWTDIIMVAAGDDHTVGLKSDGTVVAVGRHGDGQCDVSEWTDIIMVAAGEDHTVGLKSGGTVVVTGGSYDNDDVSEWRDIVAVAASHFHIVGLKSDGTVVAIGSNDDVQYGVSGWTDIKLPK